MKIPDIIKDLIVPSSAQLYGETFHREKNLDEYFGQIHAVVEEQAKDEALWCYCDRISEAYIQQELRRLHEIIEGKPKEKAALKAMGVVNS